jgi:Putative ER transporter, 6TM, N-terminal
MSEPSIIVQYVHEGILAVALSVGGWIVLFPFRTAFDTLKEKSKILEELKEELVTQRTNCLATIQTSNQEQVKLLEKAVEVLEDIHLSQSEMSGFMQGKGRV